MISGRILALRLPCQEKPIAKAFIFRSSGWHSSLNVQFLFRQQLFSLIKYATFQVVFFQDYNNSQMKIEKLALSQPKIYFTSCIYLKFLSL